MLYFGGCGGWKWFEKTRAGPIIIYEYIILKIRARTVSFVLYVYKEGESIPSSKTNYT